MALRGLQEITQNLINNIHDALPEADTKEGTFVRDVFINPSALEMADIYDEIRLAQMAQSILTATGEDLDKLASNLFVERKPATPAYGTLRFYIKAPVTSPVVINRGTTVSKAGTSTEDEKIYATSETRVVPPGYDFFDPNNPNLVYIDVPAHSTFEGSDADSDARTINILQSGLDSDIVSAENVLPFTGGTDTEEDLSLALRMSLAISGSNIGTKDGYTAFILKQEEVVDARVVGAGDILMKRDQGRGGMVDIYVRAQGVEEDTYTFDVTKEYTTDQVNQLAYSDIILPQQPVTNIVSITGMVGGTSETRTYLDGSDFDIERGSNSYYLDKLWDFSAPPEDGTQESAARGILNDKLELFLGQYNTLSNIDYYLNWNLIDPDLDDVIPADSDFLRSYYPDDNKIYQIKSKDDANNPFVGGRYFIKRDGLLYERIYYNPDFVLTKDNTDYGFSPEAKDAIRWLRTSSNKPLEGEVLEIKYSFSGVLSELQSRIDDKRVITADVLIKQAKMLPVEVYAEIVTYEEFDSETVKTDIINRLTQFINNIQKLGGTISISDIAYVIRGTEGVDDVGLDTLKFSHLNGPTQKQITATDMEYIQVERIVIHTHEPGTII